MHTTEILYILNYYFIIVILCIGLAPSLQELYNFFILSIMLQS
jgi:hypothetical protein